jgi:sulfite dehydrogenase (cytochrome) subunit B
MKIVAIALGLAVVLWAEGGPTADDTVSITLPAETVALKPGPGMDVTASQCRLCHSLDYITMQPPGGAKQWDGVVTKMVKVFGAPIGEPDAKSIVEYLSTAYGAPR